MSAWHAEGPRRQPVEASRAADPAKPPILLIQKLLVKWIGNNLRAPEFGTHSVQVISTWWAMHLAGLAALQDPAKLVAWNTLSAQCICERDQSRRMLERVGGGVNSKVQKRECSVEHVAIVVIISFLLN